MLGKPSSSHRAGPSPRARGRHPFFIRPPSSAGSIPAGAGETPQQRARPSCIRSIPAGAGETRRRRAGRACRWVHPRGRGGDLDTISGVSDGEGPSPRARGDVLHPLSAFVSQGPSPRARGRRRSRPPVGGSGESIPAGAGGDAQPRLNWRTSQGPSPRARGRLGLGLRDLAAAGSIPAGAGETTGRMCSTSPAWVHPRGRGGDPQAVGRVSRVPGPSPRARGRPRQRQGILPDEGSIPAGAGETRSARDAAPGRGVHPRGRGGDCRRSRDSSSNGGPSPRARGRHVHAALGAGRDGSIPAGAGETRLRRPPARPRWVHPRGRGGDRLV